MPTRKVNKSVRRKNATRKQRKSRRHHKSRRQRKTKKSSRRRRKGGGNKDDLHSMAPFAIGQFRYDLKHPAKILSPEQQARDEDYVKAIDTNKIRQKWGYNLGNRNNLIESMNKMAARTKKEADEGFYERQRGGKQDNTPLNVPIRLKSENIALFNASRNGHVDRVTELLARGVNMNIKDTHGFTALMLASRAGHTDVINVLNQYNNHKDVVESLKEHAGQTPPGDIPPLSQLALDNLSPEDRSVFTQFANRQSWNVDENGKLISRYGGRRTIK